MGFLTGRPKYPILRYPLLVVLCSHFSDAANRDFHLLFPLQFLLAGQEALVTRKGKASSGHSGALQGPPPPVALGRGGGDTVVRCSASFLCLT